MDGPPKDNNDAAVIAAWYKLDRHLNFLKIRNVASSSGIDATNSHPFAPSSLSIVLMADTPVIRDTDTVSYAHCLGEASLPWVTLLVPQPSLPSGPLKETELTKTSNRREP